MSLDGLYLFSDFKILEKDFSDHMPIELSICNENIQEEVELALLPKLVWRDCDANLFRNKLAAKAASIEITEDVQVSLQSITESIKSCARIQGGSRVSPGREGWFDWECFKARRDSFRLLNLFRESNNDTIRKLYIERNKAFRQLCSKKKYIFYEKLHRNLSQVRDAKQWWNVVNVFKKKTFKLGSGLSIETLRYHFMIAGSVRHLSPSMQYADPDIYVPELDVPFTMEELQEVLTKAKDNKAPGLDRIPYEFYKNAPQEFLEKLLEFYNVIHDTLEVPVDFKKSIIFPIFKKGDVNNPENYRGISFNDSIEKLFCGLLINRLIKWMDESDILVENQAGFRKDFSTVDNLFCLMNLIKMKLSKRKKLYCYFVDFKSAFDCVDRNALYFKMFNYGISTKFVRLVRELYRGTNSVIWDGNDISEIFYTDTGVRQGCGMSPTLFSLFINDLPSSLGGGIKITDKNINSLIYADDVVLMAETPSELQVMINKLFNYCQQWNLKINHNKSKIMVFRNGGKLARHERWQIGGEQIEVVNTYKYLGILFTTKLSLQQHLEEKLSMAKVSIASTWNAFIAKKEIPPSNKFRLFEAVMRAIMCYAVQVWGFEEYDTVEKLQRFFLKRLYGLPSNTPNYMLQIESGLNNLFSYTFRMHTNYIQKILGYPDKRFPKIVAQYTIRNRIYWYKEWYMLADKYNLHLNLDMDNLSWYQNIVNFRKEVNSAQLVCARNKATAGIFHDMYSKLNLVSFPNYFVDEYCICKTRLIFKARGGLLNLNARSWKKNTVGNCDLCNLNQAENTYHFIGKCHRFKDFRYKYLGKGELSPEEVLSYLDGSNWDNLFLFLKNATLRREFLLNEMNC